MGTIFGLLLPAIPGLIQLVETIFTKPGSGQTKMSTVTQALRAILGEMGLAGLLPAPTPVVTPVTPSGPPVVLQPVQPTDEQLIALIESILQQMKLNGILVTPSPAGSPPKPTAPVITALPGSGGNTLAAKLLRDCADVFATT